MIDERLETQASLYALGALPPDEIAAFEQELQSNRELLQLVAELRDAADAVLLASPTVQPPAHLKQKILNRLESGSGSKIVRLEQPARSPAFAWLPWALAACLALVCGILFFQQGRTRTANSNLQSQIAGLNQQISEANEENARTRARIIELTSQFQQTQTLLAGLTNRLAESQRQLAELTATNRSTLVRNDELTESNRLAIARIVSLDSTNQALLDRLAARDLAELRFAMLTSTNIQGVVAWNNREQKGLLQMLRLPPPPAGKDYQLWIIDNAAVSAGVIRLDAKGLYAFNAVSRITTAKQFAISLEKAGGSETPTEVILGSN
jgi:anti-sigma-K factor RskA